MYIRKVIKLSHFQEKYCRDKNSESTFSQQSLSKFGCFYFFKAFVIFSKKNISFWQEFQSSFLTLPKRLLNKAAIPRSKKIKPAEPKVKLCGNIAIHPSLWTH